MSILTYFKAGTIALVIGLGITAWHQRDERLRAEGALEVRDSVWAARIDSVRVANERERIVADSVRDAELQAADSARAEAERRATEARVRRPEIIERIVHAPDTAAVREAVAELEEAHEQEVTSLRDALRSADRATAAWRERYATAAEANERLRVEFDRLAGRTTTDTGAGFLETWGGRALALGVGAGLGYLAGGG